MGLCMGQRGLVALETDRVSKVLAVPCDGNEGEEVDERLPLFCKIGNSCLMFFVCLDCVAHSPDRAVVDILSTGHWLHVPTRFL